MYNATPSILVGYEEIIYFKYYILILELYPPGITNANNVIFASSSVFSISEPLVLRIVID